MRKDRLSATKRVGLMLTAVGVSACALAGCSAANSISDAVVSDQVPVSAPQAQPSERGYTTPDKLAIAQDRLTALITEQQVAADDRSRSDGLITALKASGSCDKATKSCSKKLDMLTQERDRLDQRLKQLPAAIEAQRARVIQLAPVNR